MLHQAFALLSAALSLAEPAAAIPPAAGRAEARSAIVRFVHDGRFDEADGRLSESGPLPTGPDRDFLRALVVYWRLLYDESNPELRSEFESRLNAALASAGARLDVTPGDAEALLWSGTARLFLAELRASDRRPFAAAKEARRARRALEAATEADPGLADASFGLGTVDVLSADLPSLAKGLGSLLGLSGNRERGLQALEHAAREGRLFSLEARLFLLGARSSRKRREYDGALRDCDLLAAITPRSVVALDGAARVRIDLGAAPGASAELDAALAIAAGAPLTDRGVIANLLVQRARAELALFRPDLALEWLRRLVPLGARLPAATRKEGAEIARTAASAVSAPPWFADLGAAVGADASPPADADDGTVPASWRAALPALDLERKGESGRAADRLADLASGSPADPVLALLAGRAELVAGRPVPARASLSLAESSPRLPRDWRGPCLLLEGSAADLAGDRAGAIALYRRATDAPSFVGKEEAWLRLRIPYRGPS